MFLFAEVFEMHNLVGKFRERLADALCLVAQTCPYRGVRNDFVEAALTGTVELTMTAILCESDIRQKPIPWQPTRNEPNR